MAVKGKRHSEIRPLLSKNYPWTSHLGITLDVVRNAESQVYPRTVESELHLTR